MNAKWVSDYYDAIFVCVERYRALAATAARHRCVTCDHTEDDHTKPPRAEQCQPTACMRGTGDGSVCDCPTFVASDVYDSIDLLKFLDEFTRDVPLVKLSRWLGYVQGVLIERGKTTVTAERDWTRSLFRPLDFASD